MAEANKQKVEMCCVIDTNEEPGGVIEQNLKKSISFYNQPYHAYAAPSPVYPYLSVEQQTQLQIHQEMVNMQTEAQIMQRLVDSYLKKEQDLHRHQLSIKTEELKQKNRLQLLEARQAYKRQTEEMTSAVICDSAHRLCREISIPNQKPYLSKPIFDFSDPKFVRFVSVGAAGNYVIELSAVGLKTPVLFLDDDLDSPKKMKRKLVKSGIFIRAPRRSIDETICQLIAFIIRNAEDREIPWTTGWNIVREHFVFVTDKSETLIGKQEGAKK
ncbi:MAG TPA: hypothetical protein DEO40_05610 [Treponema sp.]|nr:hypothetical protein [Treponema sp.]